MIKIKILRLFIAASIFGHLSMPLSEARILTDKQGNTVDARLIGVNGKDVTILRLSDKRTFTIPITDFTAKDILYIRRNAKTLTADELSTKTPVKRMTEVLKDPRHIEAARRIDSLMNDYWEEKSITPKPLIDDATYARRTYLSIIGRIPTYHEISQFLSEENSDKRSALVDQLLDSEGYISHQFNFWADLLRIKTTGKEGNRYGGKYYVPWMKQKLRENAPYDKLVQSLLTAEGYPWEKPATAYYLRDYGMPLDNMSVTARIFLGTQLQCAQCHDHPTDEWSRRDFYEMAAFTYGIETKISPAKSPILQPVITAMRAEQRENRIESGGIKKKRGEKGKKERTRNIESH